MSKSKVEKYIDQVAGHGSSRTAYLITGDNIDIRNVTHLLRWKLGEYVGRKQWKYVWFRVTDGIVLLASGTKAATGIVESHLGQFLDASQEFQNLYSGHGVQICKNIVQSYLEDFHSISGYRHSYGANR